MTGLRLQCTQCSGELERRDAGYACAGCGRAFPVRNGIASFSNSDYYYNIIPQPAMREFLASIPDLGWPRAFYSLQARLPRKARGIFNNVLAFHRAGWKFLLPVGDDARVLDLGCGWGCISIALARSCREVVSVDLTRDRLESLRELARWQGLTNLTFIHGGDGRLPFSPGQFDAIVLNGVLEWMPENRPGDPRHVQVQMLTEAAGWLKPGGVIYLAIENRLAARYLVKREDHSGLYWSSFLPRPLSDLYSRATRGKAYRTYTYSLRGYRQLFAEAGCPDVRAYVPLPDYRYPRRIVPFDRDDQTIQASGSSLRKRFAHSFSILAGRGAAMPNRVQHTLALLETQGGLGPVHCDRYLLRKSSVLCFLTDANGAGLLARMPYGPREAARERANAASLRTLSTLSLAADSVRVPQLVYEGEIGNDYVSVERLLPGLECRRVLRRENTNDVLDTLVTFLVDLGRATVRDHGSSLPHVELVRRLSAASVEYLLDSDLRRMLESVADKVVSGLSGSGLSASVCTHGDFNVGNTLCDPQSGRLTGVVDWDQMRPDGLPGWDLVGMISSLRRLRSPSTTHGVSDVARTGFTPEEQRLWNSYWSRMSTPPEALVVLASYWLATLHYGFVHSYRHLNRTWVEHTVRPSLAQFHMLLG